MRLPNRRYPYGPYSYREDDDIADYLLKLSEAQEVGVHDTPFRVLLPEKLSAHIPVITYPLSSSTSYSCEEPEPVMVYGVECGPQERLSEDEIRNRLMKTYEDDVIGERCFCVYSELTQPPGGVDACLGSRSESHTLVCVAIMQFFSSDVHNRLQWAAVFC